MVSELGLPGLSQAVGGSSGNPPTLSPAPPTPSPPEQTPAPGQRPPNCGGEGVLSYLIDLDDMIDLPQVLGATWFVANLQEYQPYFLLSRLSHTAAPLLWNTTLAPLKRTERGRETEIKRGGGG